MGHRDSSTALSGAGAFRASGSGTGAPAAKHRPEDLSATARVLLGVVRAYQIFFSALMPSACKFYPSCSQYAADALQIHGARRGSWLALRRLLRCHPFTRGGVDLVPDAAGSPRDGHAAGETILENSGREVHS
jgi:putative membrane protein insertion efficiency factor